MVKQEPYKQYAAQATRPKGMKPWEKVKFTDFTSVKYITNTFLIH